MYPVHLTGIKQWKFQLVKSATCASDIEKEQLEIVLKQRVLKVVLLDSLILLM